MGNRLSTYGRVTEVFLRKILELIDQILRKKGEAYSIKIIMGKYFPWFDERSVEIEEINQSIWKDYEQTCIHLHIVIL